MGGADPQKNLHESATASPSSRACPHFFTHAFSEVLFMELSVSSLTSSLPVVSAEGGDVVTGMPAAMHTKYDVLVGTTHRKPSQDNVDIVGVGFTN